MSFSYAPVSASAPTGNPTMDAAAGFKIGTGSVPTGNPSMDAAAGIKVGAGDPGAINTNTKDTSKDAAKDGAVTPEAPAGFSLKEILATLKPAIDPDKALANWDKFDTAAIKGVKVKSGANLADTVSPSKRYNKSQHDVILSLATPGALHGIGGMPASYLDKNR